MTKRQRAYVYRPSLGTKNIDVTECPTLQARLDAKSHFNPATGCLLRFGALNKGYGVTSVRRVTVPAHVASYKLSGGIVPPGYHVDHLCRETRCINPDHLEAVTPKENTHRGAAPCIAARTATECLRGHPYTPENTKWVRVKRSTELSRRCKTCRAEEKKRYNPRRNELRREETIRKRSAHEQE